MVLLCVNFQILHLQWMVLLASKIRHALLSTEDTLSIMNIEKCRLLGALSSVEFILPSELHFLSCRK